MPAARLTREQQKAATRRRLLEAAEVVFAERGFNGAQLDAIAAEAGHTTGAVYSNFGGKEELFLALLDHVFERRRGAVEQAVATATTRAALLRAGADNWMRFLRENPCWYPLFVEFWAYALRRPDLRAQLAERFAAFPRANAELVAQGAQRLGVELTRDDAEALGLIVTALGDGLALIKTLDPTGVPDALFGDFLDVLFTLGQQASERGS